MDLVVASEILKWIVAALGGSAVVLLIVHLFVRAKTEDGGIKFAQVALLLMVLTMPAILAKGAVDGKLLPECPRCEKPVESSFCPDCGWEAIAETVPTCPSCRAEWDSAFCGDCGSPMNQEG